MKGLIQRVTQANVSVSSEVVAEISTGLLLFLGIEQGDEPAHAQALCRKVLSYRVFPDARGRMNQSLVEVGGELLIVPQFTLAADTRSGNRPSFSAAAPPAQAKALFEQFIRIARHQLGAHRIGCGQFGADMQVGLTNDGPVTFLLESSDLA
ncbi:MAG: D-tyrosyl-tRNA(Tyr) deacylase [Oleiphilaceae bacterium]|nr:D-tyrosyl-tRNA(Tyr) deacylase [Oleiphilaceae bacterium]